MFVYGCVFILEGFFLGAEPMAFMFLGSLTVMPGIAVVMAIYEGYIIKKYKMKK